MAQSGAGRPILVGVDGSASALDAVRWAAREAQRRHSSLRLVNAFGWMPTSRPDDPVGGDYRELQLQDADAVLAKAVDAARQVAPGVRVEAEVRPDDPIPELTTASRDAQLAVVGDRGLGGLTGLLIGSVAVALAAHGRCPVVVVRGAGATATDGPVVVGVDGSPTSDAAVRFGFEAAAARGAPLVAVHAWEYPVFAAPAVALIIDWDAVADMEAAVLAARVAGWAEKFPDVQLEQVTVEDRAAHALLDRSAGAQLLVVGSRGRGSLAGLVLGSVGHALLHLAECPVAVVRPDTDGSPP